MVIPPEWAQKAPEFLKKLGIAHQYQEFPVGHGVSRANFESLLKWLSDRS
jgi:phospholipase/carboxylesterase